MRAAQWTVAAAVIVGVGIGLWAWRTAGRVERAAAPQPAPATVTLTIEGMTCAGCAASVKLAAKRIEGVGDAVIDLDEGTAVVTYDPGKTTPETIARAITEETGFKASVSPRAYNRF
jgi:copper chaperone CopZ